MPAVDAAALSDLKRRLARALVKARLDLADGVMGLSAWLEDFRWKGGASPKTISGLWEDLLDRPPVGHEVELEISVPFCRSRCVYCMFPTRVLSTPGELDCYVRDLRRELDFLSRTFSNVPLNGLLLGRGTPSLLSSRQFALLMEGIRAFRFRPKAEWSIEANPASSDGGQIRLMRSLGFNRISFGVESMDRGVLRSIGRGYQDGRRVADCVGWARQAGFQEINIDLVLGLAADSVETFLCSFRACLALRPTSVAVCLLTTTDRYLRATRQTRESFAGRLAAFIPRAFAGVRELAVSAGYSAAGMRPEQGIWTVTARSGPSAAKSFARPLSVLGAGHQARSHVFGRALYQRTSSPFGGRESYRLSRVSPKEGMARYLLENFNDGRLVRADVFQRIFREDLAKVFSAEIRVLEALGKIRWEKGGLRLMPEQDPQRAFYAAFFLMDALLSSTSPDLGLFV